MKTASVHELRTAFPRIERWLLAGERALITKRGKVVAEMSAPVEPNPDFARRFGGTRPPARAGKSAFDLLMEERGH